MKEKIAEALKKFNGGFLRGSQKKLADKIGTSEGCISDYVKGKRPISEKHLPLIAEQLKKTEKEVKEIFKQNINDPFVEEAQKQYISTKEQEIEILHEKIRLKDQEINLLKQQIHLLQTNKNVK